MVVLYYFANNNRVTLILISFEPISDKTLKKNADSWKIFPSVPTTGSNGKN